MYQGAEAISSITIYAKRVMKRLAGGKLRRLTGPLAFIHVADAYEIVPTLYLVNLANAYTTYQQGQ